MNKNVRFVPTLIAAALFAAGSAQAQTNTGSRPGLIGGTLGALRITTMTGTAARGVRNNIPSRAPVYRLVGGVLRPIVRPGSTRSGMNANSGAGSDASLPGLAKADSQMRDDESSSDDRENAEGIQDTRDNDSANDADDAQSASASSDMDGTTQKPDETSGDDTGMEGSQGSRQSGNVERTSTTYRGNRTHESRGFHVGFQVGRTMDTSNEQQGRQSNRTVTRGSEASYQQPASGQNAAGGTTGSGTQQSGTPSANSGDGAAATAGSTSPSTGSTAANTPSTSTPSSGSTTSNGSTTSSASGGQNASGTSGAAPSGSSTNTSSTSS
jgi:hypothetical protein